MLPASFLSDGLPVGLYHGVKNGLSGSGVAGTKCLEVSNALIPNVRLATQRTRPVRGMSTCAAKPESVGQFNPPRKSLVAFQRTCESYRCPNVQDGSGARRKVGVGASAQRTHKLASPTDEWHSCADIAAKGKCGECEDHLRGWCLSPIQTTLFSFMEAVA